MKQQHFPVIEKIDMKMMPEYGVRMLKFLEDNALPKNRLWQLVFNSCGPLLKGDKNPKWLLKSNDLGKQAMAKQLYALLANIVIEDARKEGSLTPLFGGRAGLASHEETFAFVGAFMALRSALEWLRSQNPESKVNASDVRQAIEFAKWFYCERFDIDHALNTIERDRVMPMTPAAHAVIAEATGINERVYVETIFPDDATKH